MRRSGAASVSSPKRRVNTLAKENPATCQNHTLVKRTPTPRARRPLKDTTRAHRVMR